MRGLTSVIVHILSFKNRRFRKGFVIIRNIEISAVTPVNVPAVFHKERTVSGRRNTEIIFAVIVVPADNGNLMICVFIPVIIIRCCSS